MTRQPQLWLGLALISALLMLVGINHLDFGQDPALQRLDQVFLGPSASFPLGTDQFGRCNLARLAAAIENSLLMSLLCVITAATLGTLAGLIAGWYRGWADRTLSFAVNVLMALPGLVLVLLFAALVPGSFWMLYLAISAVIWVEYFRLVRSVTLSARHDPAIQASQLYGFGKAYLLRRHLLPRLWPDLLTLAAFGAANAILALASIGFVYVGLKPPEAELGLMMVELFPYYSDAPWVLLQPLLTVFALILGFNLLAMGLQDGRR
ncbi:ABC transporter permease [Ferrimonas marina]|uniref:Peptide/nickel transport system permease protein n=1 Tax=Ferrimonas marina TaxID=299255 RepID=A0A1M5Z9I3_9GAMM|nr:ABC transporter permease [Ferrimonas marina]SHI20880.1 peptide/nickel transport system permease protein [Ferrimonas marina]